MFLNNITKKIVMLGCFISGIITGSQNNPPVVCPGRHDMFIDQNLKTKNFGVSVLQCPHTKEYGNRLFVYSRKTAEPVMDREYHLNIKSVHSDDKTYLNVELIDGSVYYNDLPK